MSSITASIHLFHWNYTISWDPHPYSSEACCLWSLTVGIMSRTGSVPRGQSSLTVLWSLLITSFSLFPLCLLFYYPWMTLIPGSGNGIVRRGLPAPHRRSSRWNRDWPTRRGNERSGCTGDPFFSMWVLGQLWPWACWCAGCTPSETFRVIYSWLLFCTSTWVLVLLKVDSDCNMSRAEGIYFLRSKCGSTRSNDCVCIFSM